MTAVRSPVVLRLLLAFLCMGALVWCDEAAQFDRYGGLTTVQFAATGFFRTEHDGERWWLVTPEGHAFLSVGVNSVGPAGDVERGTNRRPYQEKVAAKYASVDAWRDATEERFRAWGVNTIACWSGDTLSDRFPYTVYLGLAPGGWAGRSRVLAPDFFTAEFQDYVEKSTVHLRQYADDPRLLGYFLANELPWASDYRLAPSLFGCYLLKPADAPGKQRMVQFFQERYGTLENFSRVWKAEIQSWADLGHVKWLVPVDHKKAREDCEAFTELAARKYYEVTTNAVREADPNHLILGCRFIWQVVPSAVVKACGAYCDVVAINFYETGDLGKSLLRWIQPAAQRIPTDPLHFDAYHRLTGKPLLIGEFSFRSEDSGLPNTFPPPALAQPNVKTQAERGEKYRRYVTSWAATPYFVGFHWFEYVDQPKKGRPDGENGNFGLVTIDDEPYTAFLEPFTDTNRRVWAIHQKALGALHPDRTTTD